MKHHRFFRQRRHNQAYPRVNSLPLRRLRVEPLEDRRLLATLVVNSPLDNTTPDDDLVTLREAILAANADTTTDLGHTGNFADEITFDFGHDGPETIVLTKGQLAINGDLTILGSGDDLLTIDASGSDMSPDADNGSGSRIFDVLLRPVVGWDVTLQGLTLTGGDANGWDQAEAFPLLTDRSRCPKASFPSTQRQPILAMAAGYPLITRSSMILPIIRLLLKTVSSRIIRQSGTWQAEAG